MLILQTLWGHFWSYFLRNGRANPTLQRLCDWLIYFHHCRFSFRSLWRNEHGWHFWLPGYATQLPHFCATSYFPIEMLPIPKQHIKHNLKEAVNTFLFFFFFFKSLKLSQVSVSVVDLPLTLCTWLAWSVENHVRGCLPSTFLGEHASLYGNTSLHTNIQTSCLTGKLERCERQATQVTVLHQASWGRCDSSGRGGVKGNDHESAFLRS